MQSRKSRLLTLSAHGDDTGLLSSSDRPSLNSRFYNRAQEKERTLGPRDAPGCSVIGLQTPCILAQARKQRKETRYSNMHCPCSPAETI
jgi:hypothetical protein